MEVGFIGLGNLGRAIASRLIDCGYNLIVWNRTLSKCEGLGAQTTKSISEVVISVDVVFLCLFDSSAVRSVLTGKDGLLAGNVKDKVIVDITTNHYREVLDFYGICKDAGATYMECPVLGSVVPARNGSLTVLVSGEEAGYERIRSILQCIGKHIFYLKEPSLATKMKLINNLTLGSFMATIAEAVCLGEEVGIEKKTVLDILSVGGGDSLVLNAKKEKLLNEDFSTHFSSALIYKDLHFLQDLAYELKKSLFTGSVVKELFAKTFDAGISNQDFSAIYKLLKGRC